MTQAVNWDGTRYDKVADPQTRWGIAVLDRLELAGDECVLDAGCGTARVTDELLGRLPRGRVIGLDASQSMLAKASTRLRPYGDRARLVKLDLLDLNRSALGNDAPLDAVFSTATFHWITDHDRLFANLASVLKAHGQLVAQYGGIGNIERVLEAVRSLGVERVGDWLYATPKETSTRLERAGFEEIAAWTHPEPTPFASTEALADFLEAVCLRQHLDTLPPHERRTFVERVARAMDEPVIDYVRLNVIARRSG